MRAVNVSMGSPLVVACMLLSRVSYAQIAPCGGSCGSPVTAPVCIIPTGNASVNVIGQGCVNGDLEFEVVLPQNQSAPVTISVYAPNFTFRDIRVRVPVSGTAVGLIVQSTGSGSISSIRSITQSAGSGELWIGSVVANSLGVGGIEAASINVVRAVTGDIVGPIVATGSQSVPGNISSVRADQGNILGDVTSLGGFIDEVLAPNGSIGSASYIPNIAAKQNIKRVEARQIWAHIDALYNGGNSTDSRIWRVAATNGGFHGTISSRRVDATTVASGQGVFVTGGDLDGDILLTDELKRPITVSGVLPLGRVVRFSRSRVADAANITLGALHGDLVVLGNSESQIVVNGPMTGQLVAGNILSGPVTVGSAGAPGLSGCIIVNANNNTPPSTWTGDVKPAGAASSPLSPKPYHADLSSAVGGGAVGVVPFHLHGADCVPPNTPSSPPSQLNAPFSRVAPTCHHPQSEPCYDPATQPGFVLRFYGPVKFGTGVLPVFVSMDGADPAFNYAQFMTATIENSGRDVRLRGDGSTHFMPGRYRVRPLKNVGGTVLSPLCDKLLTPANVGVDPNFEYVFDLEPDCNKNGRIDTVDLGILGYDAWPHDGVIDACDGGICEADYTRDGNLDQSDVDCLIAMVAGDSSCAPVDPTGLWVQDPDFTGDGNVDQGDVSAIISYIAGEPCP